MAITVKITSIEALQDFRAALIVYLSKAKPALEEVSAEIGRTRVWLQYTQKAHWESIAKKRARALEEAQAAMFSSKLSIISKVSSAEQLALAKAKRAYEEAEGKLRVLRKWDRDFDNRIEPPSRQLERLNGVLTDEMGKALHFLTEAVERLAEYAGTKPASFSGDAAAPATEPTESTEAAVADEAKGAAS
jgi:hypothetical protein